MTSDRIRHKEVLKESRERFRRAKDMLEKRIAWNEIWHMAQEESTTLSNRLMTLCPQMTTDEGKKNPISPVCHSKQTCEHILLL
ncbi:hypothetical protein PoB_003913600 [Plakobranchus ocellatus]|uniref:Uncharacterized protein n=1 Tax=Plakobranchus ocellatus TaxID=259542 RepID=A0AAV4B1B9_9GAST|nr:hypothetical protein PoB_003913600 [Plakobranchus ocellatus]